jgi:hypothetical protein
MAQNFEENLQGSVKNSQETQTASIEAGTPKQFTSDHFSVGSFSRKNAKEVGSNLKSLLALQQGKSASPHRARAHRRRGTVVPSGSFAPSVEVDGGITSYHRRLTPGQPIEAEDVVQYGSAPGH